MLLEASRLTAEDTACCEHYSIFVLGTMLRWKTCKTSLDEGDTFLILHLYSRKCVINKRNNTGLIRNYTISFLSS